MRIPRLRRPMLVLALILGGSLAPARFSATGLPTEAQAECTTCCPDPGAKCVVCAANCTAINDAYDNGGGRCQQQT